MAEATNPYASPTERHPPIAPAPPPEASLGSLAGMIFGLRLVLFGLVGIIVFEVIFAAHPFWMDAISVNDIAMRLKLLLFVSELLALSGIIVCLTTPKGVRAERPLRIAAAAAVLLLALDVVRFAAFLIPGLRMRLLWSRPARFSDFVLTSAVEIAFLLCLKRLAWFVHRRRLIVASHRMIGFTIAMIGIQFWQSGYAAWGGNAWLDYSATMASEHVVQILWPTLFILAAALIHGLRNAVSVKQARLIRLVQKP